MKISATTILKNNIMLLLDFLYYCLLSIVPPKAIFGKIQVASTLFSSYTSFLIFGFSLWCMKKYDVPLTNIGIGVIVVLIFGGLFFLFRGIYLNDKKQERLSDKYNHLPKWLFKLIGILYMFVCFIGFVILAIATSKLARS